MVGCLGETQKTSIFLFFNLCMAISQQLWVASTKFNKAKYREPFQLFKNMFFKGGQTWTRAEASAAVQQPEAEPQKIGRIDRFDETVGFTARGGACTVEWFEGISVFGEDLRNQ
uniref:(northern house mosquito) hypothetical protein n=1 Tax=Culex pipiens TaxID=7175 RepID=A0A8D8B137_CULPI